MEQVERQRMALIKDAEIKQVEVVSRHVEAELNKVSFCTHLFLNPEPGEGWEPVVVLVA